MNLKEFDYKQFLLEKGERVGLGVAVTLMVLMLIFSLFMPSRGFFSGSPSKNADLLATGAKQLDSALNAAEPTEAQKPGKARLIALDTERLNANYYALEPFFSSDRGESAARRPPTIYNLEESAAKIAFMDIDTYLFNKDFTTVVVLRDKEGRTSGGAAPAGGAGNKNNPWARMYGQGGGKGGSGGSGGGGMPPMMGGSGAGGNSMQQQMMRQFGANRTGGNVLGADDKPEYTPITVKLTNLDSSAQMARQLRPVRMAIIAGSFPYKNQLEEHKSKLHLSSIQDVLNEGVDDEKGKQQAAFRFMGLKVERKEVDADGKDVAGWKTLDIKDAYALWLLNSGLPFEADDPKYDLVKPLDGLVMPRLREFREEGPQNPAGMTGPGMVPPGFPGAAGARDDTQKPAETKYPKVEDKLQKIADTLTKLEGVKPKQIARVPDKFRKNENFDPFNPNALSAEEPAATADGNKGNDQSEGATIPDHVLVRFVDVTVDPGKSYRYRVKVRMANPNYNNANVASPSYKEKLELESKDWYEVPQTLTVPSELIYYVCDEMEISKGEKHPADTAISKLWLPRPSKDRQVVFQLHRWVESIVILKDPTPIGEWAIADRVIVSRGEFVGQPVKVDVPVWKYTLDSFVLPAEEQRRKPTRTGRMPTGVTVNFGPDDADTNTILVDFDGPRHYREFSIPGPDGQPKTVKVDDTTGLEVLMLSPEGKLLARNSLADSKDEERTTRRKEVMDRLAKVREGKSGGPATGGSGLDTPRK